MRVPISRTLTSSFAVGALFTNRRKISAKSEFIPEGLEHKYNSNWDYLPETKGTRVVYLVRHGRYHIENKDQDEQRLTTEGRQQLTETGKYLAHIYQTQHNGIQPEYIVSSTMIRAIESRDLIMAEFPENFFEDKKVLKTDRLRECAVYKPVQFPDRKSYNTLDYQRKEKIGKANMEALLLQYLHRAEHEDESESTAIIVCHANVIRYLICRLMQVRENAWLQMTLFHGSITKVIIKGDGDIRIQALGSVGFMPSELQTYSNRVETAATQSSDQVKPETQKPS